MPKKETSQNFSISKEFEVVADILTKVPNKSRFICEAIIEKYFKMQNPNSVESEVKTVISQLITATQLLSLINPQGTASPQTVSISQLSQPSQPSQVNANSLTDMAKKIQEDLANKETSATISVDTDKQLINEEKHMLSQKINTEQPDTTQQEDDIAKAQKSDATKTVISNFMNNFNN